MEYSGISIRVKANHHRRQFVVLSSTVILRLSSRCHNTKLITPEHEYLIALVAIPSSIVITSSVHQDVVVDREDNDSMVWCRRMTHRSQGFTGQSKPCLQKQKAAAAAAAAARRRRQPPWSMVFVVFVIVGRCWTYRYRRDGWRTEDGRRDGRLATPPRGHPES